MRIEASVYSRPDAVGRGCGTALCTALFAALEHEDMCTIVAGGSLPNPASSAVESDRTRFALGAGNPAQSSLLDPGKQHRQHDERQES